MKIQDKLLSSIADIPAEVEAGDAFSDEAATNLRHAEIEESVEALIAEGMANEEAEEAKVQGPDGHAEVFGGYEQLPQDEVDELADGAVGESGVGAPPSGGPSEVYTESAAAADLAEVEGFDPFVTEFENEQFERVHGQDDRVRVHATTAYPWRTICKLEITAANGRRFGCSGAMIGPRTVLTNGHCVYMHDHGGWARSIRVIPGKNGSAEPFGSATSSFYWSVEGWTRDRSSNYDYAVIVLPSNNKLGNVVGWMGLANLSFFSLLGLRVNNSGYPGDKPYGTQWWNANNILAVTARRVYYRIDTYFGQSGSPDWRFKDNKRHIVAVHNTGGSIMNGGVRLSKPVFDNLVKWKNQYT